MTCTNAALGQALNLSHSTVSRMRSGTRTGSMTTLMRLAEVTKTPLEKVALAAQAVKTRGDSTEWDKLLEKACTGASSE